MPLPKNVNAAFVADNILKIANFSGRGTMKKAVLSIICASAFAIGAFAAHPGLAEDITVGAILPLTGPGAVVGLAEQRGIEFAVDEINKNGGIAGKNLKVVYD